MASVFPEWNEHLWWFWLIWLVSKDESFNQRKHPLSLHCWKCKTLFTTFDLYLPFSRAPSCRRTQTPSMLLTSQLCQRVQRLHRDAFSGQGRTWRWKYSQADDKDESLSFYTGYYWNVYIDPEEKNYFSTKIFRSCVSATVQQQDEGHLWYSNPTVFYK